MKKNSNFLKKYFLIFRLYGLIYVLNSKQWEKEKKTLNKVDFKTLFPYNRYVRQRGDFLEVDKDAIITKFGWYFI